MGVSDSNRISADLQAVCVSHATTRSVAAPIAQVYLSASVDDSFSI